MKLFSLALISVSLASVANAAELGINVTHTVIGQFYTVLGANIRAETAPETCEPISDFTTAALAAAGGLPDCATMAGLGACDGTIAAVAAQNEITVDGDGMIDAFCGAVASGCSNTATFGNLCPSECGACQPACALWGTVGETGSATAVDAENAIAISCPGMALDEPTHHCVSYSYTGSKCSQAVIDANTATETATSAALVVLREAMGAQNVPVTTCAEIPALLGDFCNNTLAEVDVAVEGLVTAMNLPSNMERFDELCPNTCNVCGEDPATERVEFSHGACVLKTAAADCAVLETKVETADSTFTDFLCNEPCTTSTYNAVDPATMIMCNVEAVPPPLELAEDSAGVAAPGVLALALAAGVAAAL